MEDLRQRLIDFQNWQKDGEDWGNGDSEHVVDNYLRSINHPPAKSRAVGTHEDKRRICPICHGVGQVRNIDWFGHDWCPTCDGVGEI